MQKNNTEKIHYFDTYNSPLGEMTLFSAGSYLNGLFFNNQKYFPIDKKSSAHQKRLVVFKETTAWLDNYFSGKQPKELPSLNPVGSDFQKEIWKILLTIGYGEVTTYAKIAKEYASRHNIQRMSAQAVGSAIGRNPISIFIPCHRVIGTDGRLTGYAGGIERKEELLRLESKKTSSYHYPSFR